MGMGFMSTLQLILIILKFCHVIKASWNLVFIPTYICIGFYLIMFIIALISNRDNNNNKEYIQESTNLDNTTENSNKLNLIDNYDSLNSGSFCVNINGTKKIIYYETIKFSCKSKNIAKKNYIFKSILEKALTLSSFEQKRYLESMLNTELTRYDDLSSKIDLIIRIDESKKIGLIRSNLKEVNEKFIFKEESDLDYEEE